MGLLGGGWDDDVDCHFFKSGEIYAFSSLTCALSPNFKVPNKIKKTLPFKTLVTILDAASVKLFLLRGSCRPQP